MWTRHTSNSAASCVAKAKFRASEGEGHDLTWLEHSTAYRIRETPKGRGRTFVFIVDKGGYGVVKKGGWRAGVLCR